MSTQPKTFLTPEEYLEIERKAEFKSEYYKGEVFAMAGALRAHNSVLANLIRELSQQLRPRDCDVYPSDMRVQVSDTGLYTYPDCSVVCAERKFVDGRFDTLLNPTVLAEVLSPSTEAYDRGFKFKLYQSLPSLKEYVLIASNYMQVDLYVRQPDDKWLLSTASDPDAVVEVPSIGCRLKLADLYEKVELIGPPALPIRPPNTV